MFYCFLYIYFVTYRRYSTVFYPTYRNWYALVNSVDEDRVPPQNTASNLGLYCLSLIQ